MDEVVIICINCGQKTEIEIKKTGIHHPTCAWNYYIECKHCGYQNNLSKLLGVWCGCNEKCLTSSRAKEKYKEWLHRRKHEEWLELQKYDDWTDVV